MLNGWMLVSGVVGLVVLADCEEYQSGELEVEDANDDRRVGSVYTPEL